MALTTELLTVLENPEEPLKKRLKIAHNAFNSEELHALNKESLILEWMTKTGKKNPNDTWKTLNQILSESHYQNLRPNDLKLNVLETIVTEITNNLNEPEVFKCASIILENNIFQHYFKHDNKRFCIFIAGFLSHFSDVNELNGAFKTYLAFNKCILVDAEYTENFLSIVLCAILDLLSKFDDVVLWENCVNLTKHMLFGSSTKGFAHFLNSIYNDNSNNFESNLVQVLNTIYKNDAEKSCIVYKLLFVSFINSYKTTPDKIYQFFVTCVRLIGFEIDSDVAINFPDYGITYQLHKSLDILAELYEIISKENIIITGTIYNIKFSDFSINLLTSILRLQHTSSVLKIIKHLIVIDPVIITTTISEILMYLTQQTPGNKHQSELMISLFEMYLKLHRLHKFCSELLKSVRDGLFGLNSKNKVKFIFMSKRKTYSSQAIKSVQDLFPENVMNYFQECVTHQTNKQIISMMRTFISDLNEIVGNLSDYGEEEKILYIQIVCDLTCVFLSAVRIAEHTTTEITIEKYIKDLEELKDFLKKFGSALLKMEHNQWLMFSFLNLCYNWGENNIILNYYIPNNSNDDLLKHKCDNSANNLSYLHDYLSKDQWSLVSERIKNFGEKHCKQILQKLIIQKLRAVLLFQKSNEILEMSVISSYSANLETCWDVLFAERYIPTKFFAKMETSQLVTLADYLINDVSSKNNYQILAKIGDSRDLVQSVLYVTLSKINQQFKKKQRNQSKTTKIFKNINQDDFIRNGTIKILYENNDSCKTQIHEERFLKLMEIIRNLPVYSLSSEIQTTIFNFLLAVCSEIDNNEKCQKICENFLVGLVEVSPNVLSHAKSEILLRQIIENTENFKEILIPSINQCLKHSTVEFEKCLDFLLQHLDDAKCLDVALICFHAINQTGKYKQTDENKEVLRKYKRKLCESLLQVVLKHENIEGYVLVLQTCLKEKNDNLVQLLMILNKYINFTFKNINETNAKGCLLLHELILSNKIKTDLPNDYTLSIWNSIKDLRKTDEFALNYDKTITLLFEHISIEIFPVILDDLRHTNSIYLKNHDLNKITNQFGICSNLLNSSINSFKLKLCHDFLQSILEEILLYIINNKVSSEFSRDFVKLQLNIMENKQIPQSSNLIDIYFQTSQIIMSHQNEFDTSFSILESFLKHRKILLIDRLPAFLIQLRNFIYHLSVKSDSELNLTRSEIIELSNYAFRVEQLIKNICSMKKDVARLAPYLIADILKRYEKVTLYPEVKNHLNNSLNYLIDLCDSHAVSYLLRVLSTGSREMFKNMHENYKKYYKFTGRV